MGCSQSGPRAASSKGKEVEEELCLEDLGIESPSVPGDVSLCGELDQEVVSAVASKFASWLYLNLPDDPAFYPEEIKSGGVKSVEVRHIPGPTPLPSEAQVAAAFESLGRLPRPLLIQCSSGNRAGALLLLWLAKKRGLGAEQAKELARSINLGAWASCAEGGLRDWYLSVGPLVYPSTLLTSSGMASKLGLLAPVVGDDTWRSDWDAFDTAQL
mmetsp:Transcript_56418/g.158256  ORF Transcript_56418/g.158256 Transcript_56418/m.158256 type:complete len:214 (+) Transcript_56418:1-642(+)